MTEEERQRTMDFILAQQAQFAANQQMAEERAREWAERLTRNEENWASTAQGIQALLAIAEIHERELLVLREEMRENARVTDERMKETDERINALVNTVERIISERRNGNG